MWNRVCSGPSLSSEQYQYQHSEQVCAKNAVSCHGLGYVVVYLAPGFLAPCSEDHVDPSFSWQAIWKIPSLTCEELKIPFRTKVLVYVDDIDFNDLTASIKILNVQDHIFLSENHIVPLTQIWPTKAQDESVRTSEPLFVEEVSNALDMYRFFYTNIVLPWDYEVKDIRQYIQSRLELHQNIYDWIKDKDLSNHISEHIECLVFVAKKLHTKREKIKLDLMATDIDEDCKNARVQIIMEIDVKIIEIKSEFELLEDFIRRQKAEPSIITSKPQFCLVYDAEGKMEEYIKFFQKVQNLYPNEIFKPVTNFAMALECIAEKNTVVLNKAIHTLDSVAVCKSVITGLFDKDVTILSSTTTGIALDFVGGSVLLENLTINAAFSQCGILVRAGKTTLKNCKLLGGNQSSIQQGIIVLGGAELELINCDISGFYTAIVGNTNAKIYIYGSKIYNCHLGIRVYDNCSLNAENSGFQDCKEYGICLTTANAPDRLSKVGNFEALDSASDIFVKDVIGKNNLKGDVFIKQMPEIAPIPYLYWNPKFDPARRALSAEMVETSDEEPCP